MDCAVDRLDLFRHIKSSVRGSEKFLLVGIDVAKDKHHAFFGTPNGRTLYKNLVFDNSIKGFENLRSLARLLLAQNGLGEILYGLEPTASYHKPLAEYLIRNQEHVVYVSNVAVAKNRALLDGRWDKNDKKDAANVADLVGQSRCLFYDIPQEHLMELRSLISFRSRLKKEEHALRMRLRNNVFAQYFPELDKLYTHAGQPDDLVLSIAQHCLDPREIAKLDFDVFLKRITKKAVSPLQEKRLHELWKIANESAGCQVHAAARWEAQSLVAKLKAVRTMVKDNEHRMETVAKQFPEYQSLLSIPGFGPIVSTMVLAAIGDPFRFENRKQVLRTAGLDLSAERSGKSSDTAKPVISKQGKAALRYALVQAAMVASTLNPDIRNYFSRLLKGREFERGIKLKMKVKLAAKFLVVAWTLMKTKEQFKASCFEA
ncbi:IS110 family transposase [Geomonas oryzisoli]|uniref:IS110 family transposase n=1 Tax=Geomonas oryzisoli TaxID=2847992 RepID=A0ABX8JC14_9BACT|nr:IS110 family transposase [Geomonas oryzisoli]QWV94672.1 IS110 family transposase [Geomonas oryzisoli]